MPHTCTDCKIFQSHQGCEKNLKAWDKAKDLYPVTRTEARLDHHPMTENEKRRTAYMNAVAGRCQERVVA